MNNRDTAKNEKLHNAYSFLLTQPPEFIARYWMIEAIEKELALSFIASKNLIVEFRKFRSDQK